MSSKKERLKSLPAIHYITHSYGNPRTGGERYTHQVIKYLKDKGFPIHILEDKLMPNCTKGRRFLLYNFFYIMKFLDVKEIVVFTTDYMHPRLLLVFLFLRCFKETKIFVLVQHLRFHFMDNRLLKFLDKTADRTFLKCANVIICNSSNTKSEVEKLIGRRKDICVIRPGLNRADFGLTRRKRSDTFDIVFMGACMRRKGLEYLVESLQVLNRDDVHLHIGGDTTKDQTFTDRLVELIKEKKLRDRITLHGWVQGEEKKIIFGSSDVFVLPSLWEGYGQAIAEAMSFGLPIIATKVGAIPELVKEGVNGLLVPPKDSQSLADAISYLMNNPKVREAYGRQGRILSQEFRTWPEVGKRFEEIFLGNLRMRSSGEGQDRE